MRLHAVTVVVCALTALGGQVLHGPAVAAGGQPDRAADLAAIEKLRQQDIDATVARDPVALTDFWTDDAIRLGVGAPPEIGKETIRASNERQTANKSFKVVSYVRKPRTSRFWMVAGRSSGVLTRRRTSTRRVARRSTPEAPCWRCSRSSRTAAGKFSARWGL
jgi:hypothetical protein